MPRTLLNLVLHILVIVLGFGYLIIRYRGIKRSNRRLTVLEYLAGVLTTFALIVMALQVATMFWQMLTGS